MREFGELGQGPSVCRNRLRETAERVPLLTLGPPVVDRRDGHSKPLAIDNETWVELVGPVTGTREPEPLLDEETLVLVPVE